jgi:hypothetical protein
MRTSPEWSLFDAIQKQRIVKNSANISVINFLIPIFSFSAVAGLINFCGKIYCQRYFAIFRSYVNGLLTNVVGMVDDSCANMLNLDKAKGDGEFERFSRRTGIS